MRWRTLLAVAFIVLAGACAESDRIAIGSTDDDSAEHDDESPTTDAPETTQSTTTAPAEVAKQDLVLEAGLSSSVDSINTRYTSVGALITNPNTTYAAYDVTVVFNLIGADGAILDTDSTNVPYIPAGATVPVAPLQIGFNIPTEPASVEVEIAGSIEEDTGWDGVEFAIEQGVELDVSGAAITPDDFGPSLSFTATNPSDDVAEFATWFCVFRNGGAIVGGQYSTVVDPIVPGGSVRVDSFLSVDDLAADEIICRSYF